MSKKLESKLANSVRQAKQQNETAETTAQTASSAPAAAAKPTTTIKSTAANEFASQADQAPKPSLDKPWANLYPARIWPD